MIVEEIRLLVTAVRPCTPPPRPSACPPAGLEGVGQVEQVAARGDTPLSPRHSRTTETKKEPKRSLPSDPVAAAIGRAPRHRWRVPSSGGPWMHRDRASQPHSPWRPAAARRAQSRQRPSCRRRRPARLVPRLPRPRSRPAGRYISEEMQTHIIEEENKKGSRPCPRRTSIRF